MPELLYCRERFATDSGTRPRYALSEECECHLSGMGIIGRCAQSRPPGLWRRTNAHQVLPRPERQSITRTDACYARDNHAARMDEIMAITQKRLLLRVAF